MYQNNRNLFPLIAVLTSASILVGICGISLLVVDKVGGEPSPVSNSARQSLNEDLSEDLGEGLSEIVPETSSRP
jgi:hypothetical protein